MPDINVHQQISKNRSNLKLEICFDNVQDQYTFRNQRMPSFLESINIFHNEQFWRFKGERSISHKCGGVLTLIILIIFGAITCYQIYLINQRDTINVVTQSQIDFSPQFTNITTWQNDPNQEPYMAAMIISELSNGATFSPADYKLSAYKSTQYFDLKTSSYLYNYTEIRMESCTPYHFSKLPNIFQKFNSWGMRKWFCFPINQTFEVGGNILEVKKYLQVSLQCKSSNCNQSNSSSVIVNLMTLNTYVNPTINNEPYMAFFNRREAIFQGTTSSRNFLYIDKTILSTDVNLIPFSNIQTTSSFQEGIYSNSDNYASNNPTSTFFIIFSGKTTTHKRHYLKLLTALSYIGGLFMPIVGAFSLVFMMGKFGISVYELRFASDFFQKKKGYKFHYFGFLQQVFRNIWGSCFKSQHQDLIKEREQVKKTVNSLMDVVYLQKRIAFLQKSLSLLFQKHQLKALHMQYNLTQQQACLNYQNYRARRQFMRFLLQHKDKIKAKSNEEKDTSGAANLLNDEIVSAVENKITINKPQSSKLPATPNLLKVQSSEGEDKKRHRCSIVPNLLQVDSYAGEDHKKQKCRKASKLSLVSNNLWVQGTEDKICTNKDLIDSEELNGRLQEIDMSDDQSECQTESLDNEKGVQTLENFAKLLSQKRFNTNDLSTKIYEMMDERMKKVIRRSNHYLSIVRK